MAIPAGDNNAVEGGDQGDDPLVPTVLAPGEVAPAFFVRDLDLQSETVTWSVTGPDGVRRSATSDLSSDPECTADLIRSPLDDKRAPRLAYAYTVGTTTATIIATVVGVGPTSICPTGLELRPPLVWIERSGVDGSTGVSTGATTQVVVPLEPSTDPVTGLPVTVAAQDFRATVADVCAAAGSTSRARRSRRRRGHRSAGRGRRW